MLSCIAEHFFSNLENLDTKKSQKQKTPGERKKKTDCQHKKIIANFLKSIRKSLSKRFEVSSIDLLLSIKFSQNVTKKNILETSEKTLFEIYESYSKFPEKWEKIKLSENFINSKDLLEEQTFKTLYEGYIRTKEFERNLEKENKNGEDYVNSLKTKALNLFNDFLNMKTYKKRKENRVKIENIVCSNEVAFSFPY